MRIKTTLAVAALLLPFLVMAQPGSPDGLTYKTGYSAITKIGGDLQKALKDKYKVMIHTQPVFLETDMMPFIKLTEYPDESKPLRAVFISVGFVDLMNHVAHAKAIDRIEKGYFDKYVAALAQESGDKELHDPPKLDDKKYWTEAMMNEQLSSFNQVVGMVIAIELAHHYLGHFKKYAAQLDDTKGRPPPINNLLTPSEWDDAMKAGCINSLETGYGVDGIKALYDAINKMPQRPAWAAYFLPANLKVDKVKKDLEKIEKKFFAGERM